MYHCTVIASKLFRVLIFSPDQKDPESHYRTFLNHELLAEMLGVAREKKIEKQILKKRKFDFF